MASGLARRRRGRRRRSPLVLARRPRPARCRDRSCTCSPRLPPRSARAGASRRASAIASAIARVISSTERIASSLPAIGTVMRSGSAFVSQMATIGIPSLFASLTAMRSFFASITNMRPGMRRHVLDAREVLGELVALPRHQELLLLRVVLELAAGLGARLEVLEPADLLLDRLEVGEQPAEPALGDVHARRSARLRPARWRRAGAWCRRRGRSRRAGRPRGRASARARSAAASSAGR